MSHAGDDPFSALLYPMLSAQPPVGDDVVTALAAAPLEKAAESDRLRRQVIAGQGDVVVDCALTIAAAVRAGGRVLACGNGGSATAAADLVAELTAPPHDGAPAVPALDLSADVAVLTAVANDVSFDDVFLRQVIAFGRRGDVLVAISTSGNSENLVRALREARRRGLHTVALSGYDGGRVAHEIEVDHCVVVPSSSVHRIQEVQATVQHLLLELVQRALMEEAACV